MKISIAECAELLDGSPGWVRSLVSRSVIGDAWGNGRNRKTYVIVPSKLAKFMEISEAELEDRLNAMRNVEPIPTGVAIVVDEDGTALKLHGICMPN